jgi:hypothetical protein
MQLIYGMFLSIIGSFATFMIYFHSHYDTAFSLQNMAKYRNTPNKIIGENEEGELSKMIGHRCQSELLYKVSRDGLSADKFHHLCDDKGATVTVLQNTIGNVFGGYLSESWNSADGLIADKNAFLFKLRDVNGPCVERFSIKIPANAACGMRTWGPTFGGMAFLGVVSPNRQNIIRLNQPFANSAQCCDLHTFSDINSFSQNKGQQYNQIREHGWQQYFALNGQEQLGNSYRNDADTNKSISKCVGFNDWASGNEGSLSGGNFSVIDLEVYLVKGKYTIAFYQS